MEVLGCTVPGIAIQFLFAVAEPGSDRFSQFLNLLGDKVPLRGWQQFSGGLDIRSKY